MQSANQNTPAFARKLPDPRWAARRTIGWCVFFGFDVAFLGYLLTGIGWWFFVPLAAFVLSWRITHRAWPLLRARQ